MTIRFLHDRVQCRLDVDDDSRSGQSHVGVDYAHCMEPTLTGSDTGSPR